MHFCVRTSSLCWMYVSRCRGVISPMAGLKGGRTAPLQCVAVAEGHSKPVLCLDATDELLFTGSKGKHTQMLLFLYQSTWPKNKFAHSQIINLVCFLCLLLAYTRHALLNLSAASYYARSLWSTEQLWRTGLWTTEWTRTNAQIIQGNGLTFNSFCGFFIEQINYWASLYIFILLKRTQYSTVQ